LRDGLWIQPARICNILKFLLYFLQMEEILASIRRIIANDEPAQESAPSEAAVPQPLRAAAPSMMPPPAAPARLMAATARAEHLPVERSAPAGSSEQRSASEGLVSADTAAAVDAAFDTLAQTVRPRSGRTIEELVSELIRPMLKTWLDDNLPAIVERLVRAEIERLSRERE
jgi:uncharacterized protein